VNAFARLATVSRETGMRRQRIKAFKTAEGRLAALPQWCGVSCEEHRDLQKSIAEYQAKAQQAARGGAKVAARSGVELKKAPPLSRGRLFYGLAAIT